MKSVNSVSADRVLKAYKQFQRTGPEIFIPPPPAVRGREEDIHRVDDREKLQKKIRKELPDDFLEKPDVDTDVVAGDESADVVNNGNVGTIIVPALHIADGNEGMAVELKIEEPANAAPHSGERGDEEKSQRLTERRRESPEQPPPSTFNSSIGEDPVSTVREKRNKIKEMMIHAWTNYKLYAWGKNELRPLTKRGHSNSIFGSFDLGATIVDGLDTLYLMGLHSEFAEGRDWIERKFTLENVDADLSVFETNIRFIGGFLTCYAFTGDLLFLEKAKYVADKLLPAFQTPTGIPYALTNVRNG
ncbi:mannosyl-oligosaccharide alpha-1,2-mannosidase IA-like, partial [Anopheles bellator]|uniref:mannosyl-oligosaccharide alpha-1,2-mannosidase IA-like n=1 Tax=Anopheles bellator TaxID=139047 RepID=UPI002649C4E7